LEGFNQVAQFVFLNFARFLKVALDALKEFINQGFIARIENPLSNFLGSNKSGPLQSGQVG
jgi:hypothetical protein